MEIALDDHKHGRDWDTHLPYLVFAYHVAVQESTRASPFYLLYGPALPPPEALSQPRTVYQVDFEDYGAKLTAQLSDAWAIARENVRTAQARQKRHKSADSKLKVGDRVMVHFPGAAQGKV